MKRIEWLDSWRAIGCLMVFVSHILSELFGYTGSFFGKSGVAVLFILSAYLLCELYYWNEKKTSFGWIINFYKKRAIRILPPLFFTCIAAVFVGFMPLHIAVRQCFLLDKYSHFWVLPIEFGFYLIFPIILICMRRMGRYFYILISGIILMIWGVYYFVCASPRTDNLLSCLPLFLLGIIVSLISHYKMCVCVWGGRYYYRWEYAYYFV